MDFMEFLLHGVPVLIICVLVYLYVQYWMCHPGVERGLHWRGMVLKFACWPVFFLGFILSIVDKDIPYIPTAKQAVIGKISPFAKPLIAQVILFIGTIIYVLYNRHYVLPDTELVFTSVQTWGMIAFASISFLMALGGLYAVYDSMNLTVEDPWDTAPIP